jgi:hypothetical protein
MLNESQMETLIACVKLVTLGVMNADGIGNPIKMLREAQGVHHFFENAKVEYAGDPVVMEVIKTLEFSRTNGVAGNVVGIPSVEEVMEALTQVDMVLEETGDAQAFRGFLYQLGMTVANAHRRVSERERELLDMLKLKGKNGDKV